MKAALVIMAAGMGSRYGGEKQTDGIGPNGEAIMEYSVYDAIQAGFHKIVFIIKPEMEETLRKLCGDRIQAMTTPDGEPVQVAYVFQDFSSVPDFYAIPPERKKPFGTVHAALCARSAVEEPFAIINADDYYGVDAFKTIYDYLTANPDNPQCYEYVMVGYLLKNTVTENGTVARGVCESNRDGFLTNVTERTKIEKGEKCPRYTEDDGATWTDLDADTIVSMNMWGFHKSYLEEAWARFPAFLENAYKTNPLKGEYFLPAVVSQLLDEKKARVRVLSSADKWYGVTYKEDKPVVVAALAAMRENGLYPEKLWK